MNNNEILFIYDAKMCNPNGDPDNENRPRMDNHRNIVTDVRLKRYLRDYWADKYGEEKIFVSTVEKATVDATTRLAHWVSAHVIEISDDEERRKKAEKIAEKLRENKSVRANEITEIVESEEEILEGFIDVRLFGATMPLKSEEKGASYTFIGPVQFNWGYSLNEVDELTTNSISSTFAGRTEEYGTFGKDYRVCYSLIAFHGVVSAKRAEDTCMTCKDLQALEQALIKAIPLQATLSKIGQYPRLLLRVEYSDPETILGDMRSHLVLAQTKDLRDISDVELDISKLASKLEANIEEIKAIHFWQSEDIVLRCRDKTGMIEDIIEDKLKGKLQSI